MSKDYELYLLKAEEDAAFQRKCTIWEEFAEERDEARAAYKAVHDTWEEVEIARSNMNHEFEMLKSESDCYREVWSDYRRFRDEHSRTIDLLRHEASLEHIAMQECFNSAKTEREAGNEAKALEFSEQAYAHKERRDEINDKISELCMEIKEARQEAEWRAPKPDSTAFKDAKADFDRLKQAHEYAKAEFRHHKAERDRLKDKFESAQSAHKCLKEEYLHKLHEMKAEKYHKWDIRADDTNEDED